MKNDALISRLRAQNLVHRALIAELLQQQGQSSWDQALTRMQRDIHAVEVDDPQLHHFVLEEIQLWIDWPSSRELVE